jgi:hypothetical protein
MNPSPTTTAATTTRPDPRAHRREDCCPTKRLDSIRPIPGRRREDCCPIKRLDSIRHQSPIARSLSEELLPNQDRRLHSTICPWRILPSEGITAQSRTTSQLDSATIPLLGPRLPAGDCCRFKIHLDSATIPLLGPRPPPREIAAESRSASIRRSSQPPSPLGHCGRIKNTQLDSATIARTARGIRGGCGRRTECNLIRQQTSAAARAGDRNGTAGSLFRDGGPS